MDTVAVTWQILDVNDITGDITVKFTNQNNRENYTRGNVVGCDVLFFEGIYKT